MSPSAFKCQHYLPGCRIQNVVTWLQPVIMTVWSSVEFNVEGSLREFQLWHNQLHVCAVMSVCDGVFVGLRSVEVLKLDNKAADGDGLMARWWSSSECSSHLSQSQNTGCKDLKMWGLRITSLLDTLHLQASINTCLFTRNVFITFAPGVFLLLS